MAQSRHKSTITMRTKLFINKLTFQPILVLYDPPQLLYCGVWQVFSHNHVALHFQWASEIQVSYRSFMIEAPKPKKSKSKAIAPLQHQLQPGHGVGGNGLGYWYGLWVWLRAWEAVQRTAREPQRREGSGRRRGRGSQQPC